MTTPATPALPVSERLAFEVPTKSGPRKAFDGAWHPRSTDLELELPEMLAAVRERAGLIERVLFHLDEWKPAPPTSHDVAQLLLREAVLPENVETVQELLGLTLTDAVPFTNPAVAEQRWVTDGGTDTKDEVQ